MINLPTGRFSFVSIYSEKMAAMLKVRCILLFEKSILVFCLIAHNHNYCDAIQVVFYFLMSVACRSYFATNDDRYIAICQYDKVGCEGCLVM